MDWLRALFDPALPRRTRLVRAVLLGLLLAACGYRVWLILRFNPIDHIWLIFDSFSGCAEAPIR
jgi:hypothetical protein